MSEADALLDAIFDAPDDDTPRLVYADWLQENGQENYAEFIRLQCAAARYKVWSDEANDLWVQIGRVWNRLSDECWLSVADLWSGIPQPESSFNWGAYCLDAVHFVRGFLRSDVSVTVDQLVRYESRCWPWLPTPTFILRLDSADALDRYEPSPLIRRIRNLRFTGDLWDSDDTNVDFPESTVIDPLIKSPCLYRLKALDLSNALLSESTLKILLSAPHLESLNELKIRLRDTNPNPMEVVLHLRHRFKRVLVSSLPRE